MLYSLSKSPTWLLFLVSILPILMGDFGLKLWAVSIVIICVFFSLWLFVIAKHLLIKVSSVQMFNFRKFKRVLITAAIFTLLLSTNMAFMNDNGLFAKWAVVVLTIGQFALLYCYIFILNFVAKSIATVELQKTANFEQYASYFFCLFFFPIGIWFLNPRIKALLRKASR
jgi:hypothetical protein